MEPHTLALLEFHRIVAELAELCLSEGGRRALAAQRIDTEPAQVSARLDQAVQFRTILDSTQAFPQLWLFFLGTLFIVVTLALPNGVVGLLRRRKERTR